MDKLSYVSQQLLIRFASVNPLWNNWMMLKHLMILRINICCCESFVLLHFTNLIRYFLLIILYCYFTMHYWTAYSSLCVGLIQCSNEQLLENTLQFQSMYQYEITHVTLYIEQIMSPIESKDPQLFQITSMALGITWIYCWNQWFKWRFLNQQSQFLCNFLDT